MSIEQTIEECVERFETRDQIRKNEFCALTQKNTEIYVEKTRNLENMKAQIQQVNAEKEDDVQKVLWLMEQEKIRHEKEMARLNSVLAHTQEEQRTLHEKHRLILLQMEQDLVSFGSEQKFEENKMLFEHLREKEEEDGQMNVLLSMRDEKETLMIAAKKHLESITRAEDVHTTMLRALKSTPTKSRAPTNPGGDTTAVSAAPSTNSNISLSQSTSVKGSMAMGLNAKLAGIGVLDRLEKKVSTNINQGNVDGCDSFGRDLENVSAFETKIGDVSEALLTEEQLRKEFQLWDTNGDGTLDLNEFLAKVCTVERWGAPKLTKDEALRLLLRTTVSGIPVMADGRITFEEFCVLMLNIKRR